MIYCENYMWKVSILHNRLGKFHVQINLSFLKYKPFILRSDRSKFANGF